MKSTNELDIKVYQNSVALTHRHILAVINTLVRDERIFKEKPVLRILDAGCGDGQLIFLLQQFLPLYNKGKEIELYGYDVGDHGVQQLNYMTGTMQLLAEKFPTTKWASRIKLIGSQDAWPFEDKMFDIVVSNQVLEHVWDHEHFFREHKRVMTTKGFGLHVFPLKEVLVDEHVFLPGVHKLKSWDAIYRKVRWYTRLGLGAFRRDKKQYENDADRFSRAWADKMFHHCNYIRYAELAKLVKDHHLSLTTRYSLNFYKRKISELLRRKPAFIYNSDRSSSLSFYVQKHISSSTFVLANGEYAPYNFFNSEPRVKDRNLKQINNRD